MTRSVGELTRRLPVAPPPRIQPPRRPDRCCGPSPRPPARPLARGEREGGTTQRWRAVFQELFPSPWVAELFMEFSLWDSWQAAVRIDALGAGDPGIADIVRVGAELWS